MFGIGKKKPSMKQEVPTNSGSQSSSVQHGQNLTLQNSANQNQYLPNNVQQNNINQNQVSSTADYTLPSEEFMSKKRSRIPLKRYRYTVINSQGKKEKSTMEAENEDDARNFLQGLDYKVLEIKERSKSDIDIGSGGRFKASDLSFSLTQLSTYIKSGIPLADSVKILAKQTKSLKQWRCKGIFIQNF